MTARENWTARLSDTGWLPLAALLVGLLLWHLHGVKVAPRAVPTPVFLALLPPPPPPPTPRVIEQIVPRPVAKAPPVPVARPKPTPAQTKAATVPKSPARAIEKAIALDSPADDNPYQIAQGQTSADSFAIGGGGAGADGATAGGGGGGGGCSRLSARSYLDLVNAEAARGFQRDARINRRHFSVKARLWFNGAGGVQRAQLANSAGSASLDADILDMLRNVQAGQSIPDCIQPVLVTLVSPWGGSPLRTGDAPAPDGDRAESQTLIWKQPPTPR